ncbi:hypothetical protein OG585_52465 (plasmid) [Streptomyces sp. NBC_01340]|uniref:hypothetical protein n=1 Tax=unclassified Streptomyces TaxID=2593676 RepID=UPI0022507542|nr:MULTISPECIES: hypothetical protein [unclassified Streptomyces]MCX4460282.1 hypothetical protein [Streptomyces sp. NBC_01719]MCX4500387.1 hypothetical protein [Streptomyces sp. NBC_01728]MCX4598093.1 hypothetical protein [Streptomyces sp. NBC_01549]WSI45431.1 hypothetical protein OG585_52465 [Streptomyces sp. NBC_01340]
MTRTRLERVRASVATASLALQQIEDDHLNAGDVDQAELAAILRELIVNADPSVLDLAAELLADDAGMRLTWAARALAPRSSRMTAPSTPCPRTRSWC